MGPARPIDRGLGAGDRQLGRLRAARDVQPETKPFEGRIIGDVAQELGKSAWDTMADVAVADGLRTVFANQDRGQDDATWKRRVEVWRDPRAIVGASDAGAHLDMIDSFSFSTTLIAKAVREHELMPVEEAVHHLTARPAALYGLRDRGRLAEGLAADVVVFDPATIGPGPVAMRFDLPAGAGRVYGGAVGIEHVVVNGVPCVRRRDAARRPPGTGAALRARHRHRDRPHTMNALDTIRDIVA